MKIVVATALAGVLAADDDFDRGAALDLSIIHTGSIKKRNFGAFGADSSSPGQDFRQESTCSNSSHRE
jgi:hypothetical protein